MLIAGNRDEKLVLWLAKSRRLLRVNTKTDSVGTSYVFLQWMEYSLVTTHRDKKQCFVCMMCTSTDKVQHITDVR